MTIQVRTRYLHLDWSDWVDVLSPAWLMGYIIPNDEAGSPGFMYEFRRKPAEG